MTPSKKLTILITGCSPGGMGAALAIFFHEAGHNVYATARNSSKLSTLADRGIKTLLLDVTSASSIASAVSAVSADLPEGTGLDMLVNNAAGAYIMPLADVSLEEAKKLFDLNVWGQIAVTQAFLPLLIKAAATGKPIVVNHTSVGSIVAIPFQSIYNSSKAALSMLTQTLRMELSPFGVRVVDLKTAGVRTNFIPNSNANTKGERLPEGSIYEPARAVLDKAMTQDHLTGIGISPKQWAAEVGGILLGQNPPAEIWKGTNARIARLATMLPSWMFEGTMKHMAKLDVVEEIIRQKQK